MAASKDVSAPKKIYCGLCKYDNVATPGTSWCTECSEGYCSQCLKSHKAAKSSRNHHVIPISDYIHVEQFCVNFTCPTHDQKLDFFCRDHDSILCVICVQQKHGKCANVLSLNEASKGVKTTAVFELEHNIDGILSNIEKGVVFLHANQASIGEQEKAALLAIRKIRNQINKRLDGLQEKLVATLKKKCDEGNKQHSTLMKNLVKKKENLLGWKDNMKEMKKVASDQQAFIWIRNMLIKVRESSEDVKPLINNIQQFGVVYQSNDNVTSLVESLDSFGEIEVTKQQVGQYTEQNVARAQEQGVENMRLRLKQKFNLDATVLNVTSCLLLPNKKMLIVYYNDTNLIILNEDGSVHCHIPVSYCLFDATIIDSERVAISSGYSDVKEIGIINLRSRKLEKSFSNCFKKWPWGISYYNDRLYFIAYGEGIKEMDMNGRVLRTINVAVSGVCYVTVNRDLLYYSMLNTVYCAELSGNVIWSYTDDKLISFRYSPGLGLCSNSTVLVTGESKNVVVAISKDGKNQNILLDQYDGLNRPRAIHIDKNNVLICNSEDGQGFLYEII